MVDSHFDTIVAPITGLQRAAVSWVRLSGREAWAVASRVFLNWPAEPESHRAVFGAYVHGDSGLALPFATGHSYTGEEAVELSLHGSTASIHGLVEACLAAGARMAEPGEFTLRAFLNGRLDLTQAEAVRDTVDAATDAQLRAANLNRRGVLRREISGIRDQVLGLIAKVEASVDFSEEIGELDRASASTVLEGLIDRVDQLLATSDANRILRQGYRIAIVGPPNAGKSSLLNALLGEDRSIVTEIPGTTRDYVEEQTQIGGFPVVLIDTAGLRETSDPVESIGIQRTRAMAANADEIWFLFDASVGLSAGDIEALQALEGSASLARPDLPSPGLSQGRGTWDGAPAGEPSPGLSQGRGAWGRAPVLIANKADLLGASGRPTDGYTVRVAGFDAVAISALTRQGLDRLIESLSGRLKVDEGAPLINLRHQPLLTQASNSLREALVSLDSDAPDDLLSVLLAEAAHSLGAVTGETAMPDMIEKIFHDFCIGK